MITFRQVTDEESRALDIQWEREAVDEAWRQWEIASCVERHGGHLWELHLSHPEDGAGVELCCSYCPANTDDLMVDGNDLVNGEAGGITIRDGRHGSPVAATIPVTAEVRGSKHWTDCGWEYDVWIKAVQTGPVQLIPDDDEPIALGLGGCPYWMSQWRSDGQRGTCTSGCRDEPQCITDEPEFGWAAANVKGGAA